MSASKAGIEKEAKKDNPEKSKKFREDFLRKKITGKADKEFQKGAAAIASKLCDDSNKTNEVTAHKDIKAYFTYLQEEKNDHGPIGRSPR